MSRSRNITVEIKDMKARQSKVFTNFNQFKNFETTDDDEQFHSVIDVGLGVYNYDLDEDEFKSVEDLDQFEVIQKRSTVSKRVTIQKRPTMQRVKQVSVVKEEDDEFSWKQPKNVDESFVSTRNEIEMETKKIVSNSYEQDFETPSPIKQQKMVNSVVYPLENPQSADAIQNKKLKNDLNVSTLKSTDSVILTEQYYESKQFQRLYIMNQKQRDQMRKKKELTLLFTYDLTYLILLQMQKQKKVTNLLLINMFADFIIRLNFVAFIVVSALYSQNPQSDLNSDWFLYLIILLYLPRMFHVMTQTKLLFMNKYDVRNLKFQPLSHLFRSNFIDEPSFIDHDIHPDKREPPTNIISPRLIVFLLLPIEICLLALPLNKRKRQKAVWTYVIMCYILQGIEMIVFQPIIFMIVIYHFDRKNDMYHIFQDATLLVLIFAIIKYIVVSGLLLVRGNQMIHEAQTDQYYKIHKSQVRKKNEKM